MASTKRVNEAVAVRGAIDVARVRAQLARYRVLLDEGRGAADQLAPALVAIVEQLLLEIEAARSQHRAIEPIANRVAGFQSNAGCPTCHDAEARALLAVLRTRR